MFLTKGACIPGIAKRDKRVPKSKTVS